MDTFVVKIIFLLIPGIISSKIYSKLVGNHKDKDLEYFLEIITFSVVSYAFYDMSCYYLIKSQIFTGEYNCIFNLFFSQQNPNDFQAIFYTTLISIILAGIASFLNYHKLINKVGQWLKITNRYGDDDVWSFVTNSPNINWVYVRDYKCNLTYFGWLNKFSDSKERRELLLSDVTVYTNPEGEELYSLEALYISRDFNEISLELPTLKEPKFNKTPYILILFVLGLMYLSTIINIFFLLKPLWPLGANLVITFLIFLTLRVYRLKKAESSYGDNSKENSEKMKVR